MEFPPKNLNLAKEKEKAEACSRAEAHLYSRTISHPVHVRPHSRGDLSAGSDRGPDLTGMAHCPASFALFKRKPQDPTNGLGGGCP